MPQAFNAANLHTLIFPKVLALSVQYLESTSLFPGGLNNPDCWKWLYSQPIRMERQFLEAETRQNIL